MKKKFLAMVLTTALAALAPMTALAASGSADAEPDVYRVVALGDSLSVGYEPKMTEESIPYGYVDRIYEQALFHGRAELVNYAIIGLTTPGLNSLLQGAADKRPLKSADLQDFTSLDSRVAEQADAIAARAPEIASTLVKADLVVLTIGGNDFGNLIKSMLNQTTEDAKNTFLHNFDEILHKYATELDKAIRQLHQLAPDAQIVMADQYLPLWDTHPLYPELKTAVDTLSSRLDRLAADYAEENLAVKVVHVSKIFEKKETEYTYIALFDGNDIHPKQAGYQAMAEAFASAIWPEYLKPAPRAPDVPISVIVNGKQLLSKPTVVKNTTFLALRDIADAVHAELKWTQKTQTAVFLKNGKEVSIKIGAKTMTVNGVSQPLDIPAYFQQVGNIKKTYVPMSVIVKGLDFQLIYRQKLQTAFINS